MLLYLGFSLFSGFNRRRCCSSHLWFLLCPQLPICFSDSTPFMRRALNAALWNIHKESTAEWDQVWVQHLGRWRYPWAQWEDLGDASRHHGQISCWSLELVSRNPVTLMSLDILVWLFPSLPFHSYCGWTEMCFSSSIPHNWVSQAFPHHSPFYLLERLPLLDNSVLVVLWSGVPRANSSYCLHCNQLLFCYVAPKIC